MTLEFALVLAVSILTLCIVLVGVAALRSWRTKMLFAIAGLLLLATNVFRLAGRELQSPDIDALSVSSAILIYPSATILILTFFHGHSFTRKIYYPLMILAPTFVVFPISRVEGWMSSDLYSHSPMALYAVACLGISIGESASHWVGSSLLREEGYLLVLSSVVLLATGPAHYLEMGILGENSFVGPSLGLPLFASLILIALLRANHIPPRRPSGSVRVERKPRFDLEPSRIHFMTEKRPKLAGSIFADLVRNGRPGLALTSSSRERFKERHRLSNATVIRVSFEDGREGVKPSDLSKMYFTMRDFVASQKGGVALLDAFPRIVCNNEMAEIRELVNRLRHLARSTGCIFILPRALISEHEFSRIASRRDIVLKLPNVEEEVLEILRTHVGDLSLFLMSAYCKRKNIAIKDLLLEDIPDLAAWITGSLDTLGMYIADTTVLRNWVGESRRVAECLLAYSHSNLEEIQRVSSDSPADSELTFSPLVYDGREESPTLDEDKDWPGKKQDVRDVLLQIFTKHLGEAGRFILMKEVGKLGKSLNEITLEDIADIAERAQDVMTEFGGLVDVGEVRIDMELKGQAMKEEIAGMLSEGA